MCCLALDALRDEWHCGGSRCLERWQEWRLAFAFIHNLVEKREITRRLVVEPPTEEIRTYQPELF